MYANKWFYLKNKMSPPHSQERVQNITLNLQCVVSCRPQTVCLCINVVLWFVLFCECWYYTVYTGTYELCSEMSECIELLEVSVSLTGLTDDDFTSWQVADAVYQQIIAISTIFNASDIASWHIIFHCWLLMSQMMWTCWLRWWWWRVNDNVFVVEFVSVLLSLSAYS